nr:MAG TPA: hypothetical protein [Caudoviricetes sp.]
MEEKAKINRISYYELLGLVKEGRQPEIVWLDGDIYEAINSEGKFYGYRCFKDNTWLGEQFVESAVFTKGIEIESESIVDLFYDIVDEVLQEQKSKCNERLRRNYEDSYFSNIASIVENENTALLKNIQEKIEAVAKEHNLNNIVISSHRRK